MTGNRLRLSLRRKKAWHFTRNRYCGMCRHRLVGRARNGGRVGTGRFGRNRRRRRRVRHLRLGRRIRCNLRLRRHRMHLRAWRPVAVHFRVFLQGCMRHWFLLFCMVADFFLAAAIAGNIRTGLGYPGRRGNIPAKNIFGKFFRVGALVVRMLVLSKAVIVNPPKSFRAGASRSLNSLRFRMSFC